MTARIQCTMLLLLVAYGCLVSAQVVITASENPVTNPGASEPDFKTRKFDFIYVQYFVYVWEKTKIFDDRSSTVYISIFGYSFDRLLYLDLILTSITHCTSIL